MDCWGMQQYSDLRFIILIPSKLSDALPDEISDVYINHYLPDTRHSLTVFYHVSNGVGSS